MTKDEITPALEEAAREGSEKGVHPDLVRAIETLAHQDVETVKLAFQYMVALILGMQDIQHRLEVEESAVARMKDQAASTDWN